MKQYKVTFYKHDTMQDGETVVETSLGSIVIEGTLPKDTNSIIAKAFRNASLKQQGATGVKVEEV